MKRKAFTMAEVLITLMIIGVIAAMTIPTLQKNAEQQELAAGCLKVYSTLNNAISRMTVDFGAFGSTSNWTNDEKFTNNLMNYLSISKKCTADNYSECMIPAANAEQLSGTAAADYGASGNTFVTTDGMSFTYKDVGSDAATYGVSQSDYDNSLGRFVVDVNGKKAPNIVGMDIYYFLVVDGVGIVPAGANSVSTCSFAGSGVGCAAYVIANKKVYSE